MNEIVELIWDTDICEAVLNALRFVSRRTLTPIQQEAVTLAKSDLEYRLMLVRSGRASAPTPPERFYAGRVVRDDPERAELGSRGETGESRRVAAHVDSPSPNLGQIVKAGIDLLPEPPERGA